MNTYNCGYNWLTILSVLQIDQWKRVNRLELRRDKLYSTVVEKNERHTEAVVTEQMSDDDSDVDFTGWRNKGI